MILGTGANAAGNYSLLQVVLIKRKGVNSGVPMLNAASAGRGEQSVRRTAGRYSVRSSDPAAARKLLREGSRAKLAPVVGVVMEEGMPASTAPGIQAQETTSASFLPDPDCALLNEEATELVRRGAQRQQSAISMIAATAIMVVASKRTFSHIPSSPRLSTLKHQRIIFFSTTVTTATPARRPITPSDSGEEPAEASAGVTATGKTNAAA